MDEFANRISEQAAEALRHIYQKQPTRGTNPILELVAFLLEDQAGGVSSTPSYSVTTAQWLVWNRLVMEEKDELIDTIVTVLEEEQTELPSTQAAMRDWAACLLLNTLDRMGMI